MRDKFITAVSETADGIEWTTLRMRGGKCVKEAQSSMELEAPADASEESPLGINLPDDLSDKLKGDVIVSLPSSQMLMRVMEFPTADPDELDEMAGFQIEKVSPFPIDQLAVSHEVLAEPKETSFALLAAAPRSNIDAVGEAFNQKGARIHSIDGRTLGWIRLLLDNKQIASTECEIIIIDDGFDFALVVTSNGIPAAIRMLHQNSDSANLAEELAYEIDYTLIALDAERGVDAPSNIQFWSYGYVSSKVFPKLEEKTGLIVIPHDLADLPPLSEGIVTRGVSQKSNRIELIPREWIEHVERQRLKKSFLLTLGIIAGAWLIIASILFGTFQLRSIKLERASTREEAIKPEATKALENREKMKQLTKYTDRSASALECLREVTRMMPPGDIIFTSYNYQKSDGVSLRGSSSSDDIVNDFHDTLSNSDMFSSIQNFSSTARTVKGARRWVFSIKLVLPQTEDQN